MISMPTWFFPAGAGPYSETGKFTTHGEPSPNATFRFAEPIYIDKQQNFRVEIEIPDSRHAEGDPEDLRPDEHLGRARRLHDARRPVTGAACSPRARIDAPTAASPIPAAAGDRARAATPVRHGDPLRRRRDRSVSPDDRAT